MKNIKQAGPLKNKFVLVRADLNVPLIDGKVRDDFRIKKSLDTILYLQNKGAKTIVISHLGEKGESLLPVAKHLAKKMAGVKFVNALLGESVISAKENMKAGDVLILENLRTDEGEKSCSKNFAQALASLADIYVNDAFASSHRKHASIVLLPKLLPSYAGIQFAEEIKNLSQVLEPKHPFVFILGGAKISTKLPLIKKYKSKADTLFIGGAIANDFYKALNYNTGLSLVDETAVPPSLLKLKNIIIPADVIVDSKEVILANKVGDDQKIYDAGPAFIAEAISKIKEAKTILMNGPVGNYEDGFDKGTRALLKALAGAKGKTIVGGGDSVAMINKMKIEDSFDFISTGGGAMLEYLSSGTLPGIKALK